jgi:hypothetical protein
VDSKRGHRIPSGHPSGHPHFFSTHYLPMGNFGGHRTPSVDSYNTSVSSDSKYGFPLQNGTGRNKNRR